MIQDTWTLTLLTESIYVELRTVKLICCLFCAINYGYQCISLPHFDPDIDITIHMDIATNPGPATPSRTSTNKLKVLYLNAGSIKSFVRIVDNNPCKKVCKITLLQNLVYAGQYDVICICETWLNNSVLDSELLPGYSVVRKDRLEKVGVGILIAVKDGIEVNRRCDLERNGAELLVVQLSEANNKAVLLYLFYNPPGLCSTNLKLLNDSLLSNSELTCFVLIGDFSIPSISWSDSCSNPVNSGGCANGELLCELIDDNHLTQFIEGPTHCAGN